MIVSALDALPVLRFSNLSLFPDLVHFTSTRRGGVSSGIYRSLNLGYHSGDIPGDVSENRLILSKALNMTPDHIIFPNQTHSAVVKSISHDFMTSDKAEKKNFLRETDALITNLRGICIAVKTADCVPILLFDPEKKVIAAIHAGWRGTAQNILSLTIQKMKQDFGSDPENIFAGIGPSICAGNYEVGKEVWSRFDPEFYESDGNIHPDKKLLNLTKANFSQLTASGIPSRQIETAGLCTYENPLMFYSARRDGLKTGRMATGIIMS